MSIATSIQNLSARIQNVFSVLEKRGLDVQGARTTSELSAIVQDEKIIMPADPRYIGPRQYIRTKYRNGINAVYESDGTMSAGSVFGISDAAEVEIGPGVKNIFPGTFEGCDYLENVVIHDMTWGQVSSEYREWGITDPNIIKGDWNRYINFTNADPETSATVQLHKNGNAPEIRILSSVDAVNWNEYDDFSNQLVLPAYGDKVFLKALSSNESFGLTVDDYWDFRMTGKIMGAGNIMSLLDGEKEKTDIDKNHCFYRLFQELSSLQTPPELPATKLANSCYCYMFYKCQNLSSAPKLPATTLASNCYRYMFHSCQSLTAAPELPATTLASYCYYQMFYGCRNISSAPELPATKLANSCYYQMFYGCHSLTAASRLPATTLASNCYSYIFAQCSNIISIEVDFPEWRSDATTKWLLNAGYNHAETTFVCPNSLSSALSARSENTLQPDTATHRWKIEYKFDS